MPRRRSNDNGPSLSLDGQFLFFVSNRPGGMGLADLYVSRRIPSAAGDVWDTPVPLTSLNTPGIDAAPNYFANEHGRPPQLYFTSTRLGGPEDIHVSELQEDGTWGVPVPVFELNSPAPDGRSTIRSDGLEIIFDSSRDADGSTDLYASHRDHWWELWSIPEKLPDTINAGDFNARPALSHDGRTLYFTVLTAEGHLELLVSTRSELRRGRRAH